MHVQVRPNIVEYRIDILGKQNECCEQIEFQPTFYSSTVRELNVDERRQLSRQI